MVGIYIIILGIVANTLINIENNFVKNEYFVYKINLIY